MRNAKKWTVCLLALVMLLLLTACKFRLSIDVQCGKNGSGTISYVYAMDEELYSAVAVDGDDEYADYEKMVIGGETYYGTKESVAYASFDELETLMTTPDEDGLTFFKTFHADRKGIQAVPNPDFFSSGDMADMTEAGVIIEMPFTFTMEGEVKATNGQLSADGHTVSYQMTDMPAEVSIELKTLSPILFIVIGAAVILAVLAIVIFGKKKPAPAMAAEPVTVPTEDE